MLAGGSKFKKDDEAQARYPHNSIDERPLTGREFGHAKVCNGSVALSGDWPHSGNGVSMTAFRR